MHDLLDCYLLSGIESLAMISFSASMIEYNILIRSITITYDYFYLNVQLNQTLTPKFGDKIPNGQADQFY